MATATAETKAPQDHIALHRHRFTADELERMAAANIFTEDDRLELIAGEIIARL